MENIPASFNSTLVRLEVDVAEIADRVRNHFNSTLVRLEDRLEEGMGWRIPRFNSTLVRLEVERRLEARTGRF